MYNLVHVANTERRYPQQNYKYGTDSFGDVDIAGVTTLLDSLVVLPKLLVRPSQGGIRSEF
jgi:hypothetical protein